MGICLANSLKTLPQLIQSKYSFGKDEIVSHTHHLSFWQILSYSDRFQPLTNPIQFYSDQCYIILYISKHPNNDFSKNMLASMAQGLFTLQSVEQKYINEDFYHCEGVNYKVCTYILAGDSTESNLTAKAIYEVSRLQQYLRRGQGYAVRSIFNDYTNWKGLFQTDHLPKIDLYSQQYKHLKKFHAFSHIFQNSEERLKIMKKYFDVSKKVNYDQIYPIVKIQKFFTKQKLPQQSKPFQCEMSEINVRTFKHLEESQMICQALQQVPMLEEDIFKIDNNLYIGTYETSKQINILTRQNITMIINCAADSCRNWFLDDINYKWFFMKNEQKENIQCILYDTIQTLTNYGGNIYIHCYGDNQRSTALAIGIIMVKYNIGYADAYDKIKQKYNNCNISKNFVQQLKQFQLRRNKKKLGKQSKVFIICSYQKQSPQYLVAKYLGIIEPEQIVSIPNAQRSVIIQINDNHSILHIGYQCQYTQTYIKFGKQFISLLNNYQFANKQNIKIQKYTNKQSIVKKNVNNQLLMNQDFYIIDPSKQSKGAGYLKNQKLTLKYPMLRPIWQQRKDDGFYFIIRQTKDNFVNVNMIKGPKWIGYEQDKDEFFDRIVKVFLQHIPHNKIMIQQNADDSLLDDDQMIL